MLARLLPKLKTVPVVVAVPKHPTLKLTAAGLAFKPSPPKLNPPAVVLPAPSPPNPAANGGRQRERENNTEELNEKRSGLNGLISCKNVHLTSVGGAKTKSCGRCGSSSGGCPETRGCESYNEKADTRKRQTVKLASRFDYNNTYHSLNT